MVLLLCTLSLRSSKMYFREFLLVVFLSFVPALTLRHINGHYS